MPRWKATAIADRKQITAYIARDNPRAAREIGDMFISKAAFLDQYPTMGRLGRVKGTRELVVHSNYILVYRIIGQLVEILRVKHAAQKWPD